MKISSLIKTNLAITAKQGQTVRDKIQDKINKGKRVTLDCGDLQCMTTIFIYPIVNLLHRFPSEWLSQNIRFINLSESNTLLIKKCFEKINNDKDNIAMTRPDLNELSKQIYEANKEKGFHEKEHANKHYLCLVVSELMEAVEAHRKDKYADLATFEQYFNSQEDVQYDNLFISTIKDTVEDELADAVIRMLDLAGLKKYNLSNIPFNSNISEYKEFTENVFDIISEIICHEDEEALYWGIRQIEHLCRRMKIDLWKHIDYKLKYNSTRPYKHGKLY